MKNLHIYLPNPLRHNLGLSEAEIGMMIMVRNEETGKSEKYVVRGTSSHNDGKGTTKRWGLTITPLKNWTGDVIVPGIKK